MELHADQVIPADDSESIAPGITCEMRRDNRLVIFTFRTVARDSIDQYVKKLRQIIGAWPAEKPLLMLQDFSDQSMSMTPYIREKMREARNWRPDLQAYVALISPRNMMVQLMQLFLRLQNQPSQRTEMFFSREDGLAWLTLKLRERPDLSAM